VDTCLPALAQRAITPDLAVILESQHWNLKDFSGAKGREIDAAIDMSALPASTRVLAGRSFFFATPWTELGLFKRLAAAGLLPQTFLPLGSVALSAVALALRVTSGPVLIGGIDFSFTLDCYHACGTPDRLAQERTQLRTKSLMNAAAAFKDGAFTTISKNGENIRSDLAMRNYRDLFQREFGENTRLLDISGSGLPLGTKIVSLPEAFAILSGENTSDFRTLGEASADVGASETASNYPAKREKAAAFIRQEIETLRFLREALSGERAVKLQALEELLDAADYLWAHFPDCAGAGGRRPAATDESFLKRARTEIEPFLKCWEMALSFVL
jgi:hypothetical protein